MTSPLFMPEGETDRQGVTWYIGSSQEADSLLRDRHYLGPLHTGAVRLVVIGERDHRTVAAQVWKLPTSRNLPADETWLELARWCLTPEAGPNAGSRQHRYVVPLLHSRGVRTLLSYSDPSAGHTGALYRACNWQWAPTWHRPRPPPSGLGCWDGVTRQEVKDRWVFPVTRHDPARGLLVCDDLSAVRVWLSTAREEQLRQAERSPYMAPAIRAARAYPRA